MPAARASASPPASARLLMTCVIAPSMSPRAAAAISAARLEPRPETRTLMRASGMACRRGAPSGDDGARRAGRTRHEVTDRLGVLAGCAQERERALGVARGNGNDESDAAVEDAVHFRIVDVAVRLQPIED